MIDLHAHILPGVDDGPATVEGSIAMAAAAAADGITAIAATPHVRDDWPTTPDTMERAVAELRTVLADAGIPIELHRGGEIALDHLAGLGPDDLRRFSLAGSGRYILVEFPYYGWPLGLEAQVSNLAAGGLRAVIAHPERNHQVQVDPGRMRPSVLAGALVQLTADSVDGRSGKRARACASRLLDLGLAHLIASDAHVPEIRGIGLAAAVRAIGDEALGRWLTEDVPAAIVAGLPIADPPPQQRRRRLFGF